MMYYALKLWEEEYLQVVECTKMYKKICKSEDNLEEVKLAEEFLSVLLDKNQGTIWPWRYLVSKRTVELIASGWAMCYMGDKTAYERMRMLQAKLEALLGLKLYY